MRDFGQVVGFGWTELYWSLKLHNVKYRFNIKGKVRDKIEFT